MNTATIPFPSTHSTSLSAAAQLRRLLYSPERMSARGAPADMIALYAGIPDQSLLDLSTFAQRHELQLTAEVQDVMLMPRSDRGGVTWEIVCHPSGFQKIARKTGLFRPGSEAMTYVDDGLLVTTSGYYRDSVSEPWTFSTSAFAHAHTYMEMTTKDEGMTWEPTAEWKATPETRLAEIARVLCIQKAIPDAMKGLRVSGMALESVSRMKARFF